MSEVHRPQPDVLPRPPWEFELLGVRCPVCALGGDIPSSIERTLCPRCGTVFPVLSSLAARPEAEAIPLPTVLSPPPQHEPTPAPPAPTITFAAPPQPAPPAPLPAPPPPPEAVYIPAAAPEPTAPILPPAVAPAGRSGWWTIAAIGLVLFALGVLVGWSMTRDVDDGARGDDGQRASPLTIEPVDDRATTQVDPPDGSLGSDGSTEDPATPTTTGNGKPAKRSASKAGDGSKAGASRASSTTRPGSTTSRSPATTRRTSDGGAGPTTPPSSTTSEPGAGTARPAVPLPASRGCSGVDCLMTGTSSVAHIPIPADAAELMGPGGATGWTTRIASIEGLTDWYRTYLGSHGWTLKASVSVLDPSEGEARELGHATSAVYCPDAGNDAGVVAVNIGWPNDAPGGAIVVLAIVGGIDDAACA